MRITGGKFKGYKIKYLVSSKIRPTTDMVRESLFNILDNEIDWNQTKFLDLFSGSGIVSLEVLSRGGKEVFSIDQSKEAVNNLKIVSKDMSISNLQVMAGKIPPCLSLISKKEFDIIFADPPYNWSDYNGLLNSCVPLLSKNGKVILEHDSNIIPVINVLKKYDERKYGQSTLSFFCISS